METNPYDDPTNFFRSVQSNDLDKVRSVLSVDNLTLAQAGESRSNLNPKLIGQALCDAILLGLKDMIKLLIEFGPDLEAFGGQDSRPIHYAVAAMDLSIIQLLLSHGANVNGLDYRGDSPLHYIAQRVSRWDSTNCTNEEIIDVLIKAGADIDIQDRSGRTPLALACIRNCNEVAKYLIRLGANVNKEDREGYSPLIHAIDQNYGRSDPEVVALLLAAGADPDHENFFGDTPLTAAVRVCSETNLAGQLIIEQLIGVNCNLDHHEFEPEKESPIHLAITRGQYRVVERLIRAGCHINKLNKLGESPIERLSRGRHLDLVKLLLALGARTNFTVGFWNNFFRTPWYNPHLDETQDFLQSWVRTVAPLSHFCRIALRRHWRRNFDSVISSFPLPTQLKEYLLCNIL